MPRIIQPSIGGAVKAALDNTPLTSPQPEITRAIMAALDASGGGTGGGTVKWFATTGDRDAYYASNPDELAKNPTVGVGDPAVAWQWNGTEWVQSAIALQGPKGDKGDTGATGPAGPPGVNGVMTVNGFDGNVSIGTAFASNIKVQDFFSTSDFAVGSDGKIESIGGAGGGPVARKPELFKYGGDAEAGYTPIISNVITVVNTILFIDYILILNGSTGMYYLQDNGSDYTVGTNTITVNNPVLADGMKIKVKYYS